MDVFSTNVLVRVVESLIAPQSFLLNNFFPNVQTENTEEIHFDTRTKKRRMTPFVSPLVEGKIVQSNGYKTATFKPAYTKDKRVFDANRPFRRSAGESIGGSLSPMERMMALLRTDLADQIEMLQRRQEWMAAQVLRTGAVTVSGDLYDTVSVSFGRDAALTVVKPGGSKWTDAGVNPLKDLADYAQLVFRKSGAMPVDVVMDPDAWAVFKEHAKVESRLASQRALGQLPTMMQGAKVESGGTLMGTIDNFNIWAYADWYIDDAGVEQPMLPSGTVLVGSAGQLEGYRAYGAIKEEKAGLQGMPYFPKSWINEDPAVRYLLMQSAPLVVPYRPDACLASTVL
jgi:hypothetical protein